MPILVMALLALVVFGLIGILLTVAVVMEHSAQKRAEAKAAQPSAPNVVPTPAASINLAARTH